MEQLVDKGLCKAIGISNFTIKKTQTLLETARIVPACNQGMLVFDIFLFACFLRLNYIYFLICMMEVWLGSFCSRKNSSLITDITFSIQGK